MKMVSIIAANVNFADLVPLKLIFIIPGTKTIFIVLWYKNSAIEIIIPKEINLPKLL
ncbi:hypothetical protein ES708_15475 [subsurface metagenome]